MNQQLPTPIPTSLLPAPMSVALHQRLAVALNRVEAQGLSLTIAAENALSLDDRQALERRQARLAAVLAPAGEIAAAVALGEMRLMMLDAGRSEPEADKALDLWVKHLADLPSFALEAATRDFLRGDVGDKGFVPKLPVFRQHAVGKTRAQVEERSRIGKVLLAHKSISSPLGSPERRAEAVRLAREGLKGMEQAGLAAEAKRLAHRGEDQGLLAQAMAKRAEFEKRDAGLSDAALARFGTQNDPGDQQESK